MAMTGFTPSPSSLPLSTRHDTIDIVIAAVITAFAVTHKLWAHHLAISDNIPEHFWHQVPQKASSQSSSLAVQAKSRNVKHVFTQHDLDMIVFWGSQSGRAEMLARRFAKVLHDRFRLKVLAADLADYDHIHLVELEKHQLCGFVLSTYGDGDPPDNANGLWNVLQKLQANSSRLNDLRYVIFGLGSSKYRQFNRVAEQVDTMLQSMGAERMGPAGRGDDASGETEDAFLPWRRACEEVLKGELQLSEQSSAYEPSFVIHKDTAAPHKINFGIPHATVSDKAQYTPIKPLQVSKICKLWEDDARLCIHADLDLGDDRMVKYKTGDHLAMWPSNPDTEVSRLISLLNLGGKQHTPIRLAPAAGRISGEKMPVPSSTTVHALLRYHLEICASLSQEIIADLALFSPSDDARSEIRRVTADPRVFKAAVLAIHATLADVLEMAGKDTHWDIPLSFLLERLKPMNPRYYSVSSSTVVQPRTVSLTALVTKPPQSGIRSHTLSKGCYGLATNYLCALEESTNRGAEGTVVSWPPRFALGGPNGMLEGGKIFGQIRQNSFKLPAKASVPVIMVGAGTGVAPFRAFVQERVRIKGLGQEVGRTLLFMGFRHPEVDFIYKQDWVEWRGALGQNVFEFWTAFSREGRNRKVYVQDLLKANAGDVMGLMTGGAGCRLYICGSAAMARDVVSSLMGMKMGLSGDDEEKAAAWVKQLRQSKQLLEDVWGYWKAIWHVIPPSPST